jgi:hypothetical protein
VIGANSIEIHSRRRGVSAMNVRLCPSLEPVVLAEGLPVNPVESRIGQLVGLHVLVARDTPEACLDADVGEPVADGIELSEEVLVDDRKPACVGVVVVSPLDDVGYHAVDQVRGVGFDDDLGEVSVEVAVCEHVSGRTQSVDGGVQLCALVGWSAVGKLEGFVVVRVHVAEDAAGCFSVRVAVVSTGAISGNDDGIAVRSALPTRAIFGIQAPSELFLIVRYAVAITDPACITSAKHESLVGDVAFEITRVVTCTPNLGWNVAMRLWVLTHLDWWRLRLIGCGL